jgi:hypothetical protein
MIYYLIRLSERYILFRAVIELYPIFGRLMIGSFLGLHFGRPKSYQMSYIQRRLHKRKNIKKFSKEKRGDQLKTKGSLANMAMACMSCCSSATGPIAIIAKTSLSNTTMTMITTTTTISVQRSPSTIY